MGHPRQKQSSIAHYYRSAPISNVVSLQNPDQQDFSSSWGREDPIECELTLKCTDMLPSEFTTWLKIGHMVQLTIVFADSSIRSMVVNPSFIVGRILQDPWTHHTLRALHQGNDDDNSHIGDHHHHHAPDNSALPGYGEGIEDTTLLDSNTHRMDHSALYQELYPERGDLVVPDIADELPPTYESELERPEPSSGKGY